MAIDWTAFGLVLAGELIFAIVLAVIVRFIAIKGPTGQTLWMVVVGVAGVVTIASPLIGWFSFVIMAACFSVAGIPMGIEYLTRMSDEHIAARKTLEGTLDDNTSADWEA
jgi:hypothetical protein